MVAQGPAVGGYQEAGETPTGSPPATSELGRGWLQGAEQAAPALRFQQRLGLGLKVEPLTVSQLPGPPTAWLGSLITNMLSALSW